uniref:Uncharacterized protein n=1 Tax=Arundo donax TaxID=35708 RepID=A0A0A9HE50_ARUDO
MAKYRCQDITKSTHVYICGALSYPTNAITNVIDLLYHLISRNVS